MRASESHHNATERLVHFDALRGIAACLVALTHFLAAFYPYAVFSSAGGAHAHAWWELVLLVPPISLLSAGDFAVCLFFVLSGYVLSVRLIGEKNSLSLIIGAIIKRPVRLAGILLFSLLCAAVIYQSDGFYNTQAASMSGSDWFAAFWRNEFDTVELGKKLLTGKAGSEYNPPLWTLKIELIGSFLVFGLLLIINSSRFLIRLLVLIVALIYLYGSYYDGFIWGMLLADAVKNSSKASLSVKASNILLFLVIILAAMPYYALNEISASGSHINSVVASLYSHVPMLSAVLLLSLVVFSSSLQNLLAGRWLLWLGDLSYALYAIHLLIIGSVIAYLVVSLTPVVGYGIATLIAFAAFVLILAAVSQLMVIGIDKPSVKLANLTGRIAVQMVDRLIPHRKLA